MEVRRRVRDKALRKRHGLQGPIDDAFLEPSSWSVRRGHPWNQAANEQALRMLERFDRQYRLAYRGHIRVKDDKDVTADDSHEVSRRSVWRSGQHRWIAKLGGKLPLKWGKETVAIGRQ